MGGREGDAGGGVGEGREVRKDGGGSDGMGRPERERKGLRPFHGNRLEVRDEGE